MSDAGEIARGPGEMMGNAGPGMLAGLRVIEIADERAEYTGLLLAGLGAEVVKIEPPEGNATRRIGPFLDDQPGLERSLFFWNYNRNKKSVVLDLRETPAREHMLRLLEGADVLLDASCGALNEALGLDRAALNARFPVAGDRAHDAVRRRRAVEGFQELRSDPSRARRDHDELRLRSRSEPGIRHAADRAADLARLSHRRRAARHRHHRGADPSPSQRPGPGRVGGGARGGVEEPRTRHHALGDAARADLADDQPARGGDAEPFAVASATPRTAAGSSRTAWARAT